MLFMGARKTYSTHVFSQWTELGLCICTSLWGWKEEIV